ncbi:type II secretion system F family protein [Telmatocola sphagniphila]|uniref:Type II secretion system F family protein n=1 Tax=Telmatocola sphagniphila TaxID=1123043 RepID=A0A8E6B965_9BACT|nr:type II secretion system F family protein [Telmatocola sphagniphila]QVL34183.1 type II secretion system F family protein [Telmatocola sphagniphila]
MLLAALTMNELLPMIAFLLCMGIAWFLMSSFSKSTNQAEERLARLGRPKSYHDLENPASGDKNDSENRFSSLKEKISKLGSAMQPQSELEKNNLKVTLANAGFRSDNAPKVYYGIRMASFLFFTGVACAYAFPTAGLSLEAMQWVIVGAGIGLYVPSIVLGQLKKGRQKEIFLSLPDALDLMVVCVESGLGLDAAMRKVTEEMGEHAKVIVEEFSLANMQLQMGRPRREVLHDLGVRTGVDDMRSLAAILIQADRFGSSIGHALRVQSDSMRIKRRQIAEEKAQKTAVQLIFPLVLFIFPAIFVVLCGPAAIQIQKGLLKGGG